MSYFLLLTPKSPVSDFAKIKSLLFSLLVLAVIMSSCSDNDPMSDDVVPVPSKPPKDGGHDESWLFDMSELAHITLTVTADDWNTFLTNCDIDINNSIYIPAQFDFYKGPEHYHRDSVGLRLKGNTSRRRPEGTYGEPHNPVTPDWHHCHFGIKFNEYPSGTKFCKMDRVVLKWFKDDPTYCREVYAYDLMKRFGVWIAPRVTYATLTFEVQGDGQPYYFGVYAMVEGVHKGFIKSRHRMGMLPDTTGYLWKCSWGADLSNMDQSKMGVETADFHPIYDLKTNKDKLADAKNQLCKFINDMTPLPSGSTQLNDYLNANMDVDQFLRALAVNCIIGSWDDYWRNANNYYCFFDTNGKFYFIPFDLDNVLGTSLGLNSGTQDLLNWGSRGGDRMLVRKVLSIKANEDKYKAYLNELADAEKDLFDPDRSISRILGWHEMIGNYVRNQTNEDMEIRDEPAGWADCGFYRLLSGNDKGGNQGEANYFKTRMANLP